MKITKDIYFSATTKAMMKDSTKKLFKAEPVAYHMFSLFAVTVFIRLDGKDVTEDEFCDAVATVIVDTLPEHIKDSTMIKDLALIIFSLQIWEELEKLNKPESENSEYDNIKSELNSKL